MKHSKRFFLNSHMHGGIAPTEREAPLTLTPRYMARKLCIGDVMRRRCKQNASGGTVALRQTQDKVVNVERAGTEIGVLYYVEDVVQSIGLCAMQPQ